MQYARYWGDVPDTAPEDRYLWTSDRGVATHDDVKAYLSTWFKKVPEDESLTYAFQGASYVPILRFTRAFYTHTIYVDPNTDRYIFIIADSCVPECPVPIVTGTYTNYPGVVNEIAAYLAHAWGLV